MIYLSRAQWGATLPLKTGMRLPAQGVHLHHSVTNPDDDGVYEATDDVARDMREIERIGAQRFGIFSYSYCIHPSGVVAEGAGVSIGAHTENYNSTSFGVCLIGNYENIQVTDAQVRAFHEWWWGMRHLNLLSNGYLYPHRKRKATACPGANTMKRWNDFYYATLAPPVQPVPPAAPDRLIPGQQLGPNQFLLSPNGRFMLIYQTDGNLVVYDQNLTPWWHAGTHGGFPGVFVMQTDGNAVVYSQFGHAQWQSDTDGHPGAWCVMQDDGNFVVYEGQRPLWWTMR